MPSSAGDSPPHLVRPVDGRLLSGVAAGLAEHLHVQVIQVRVAFVVLTALGGFGLVLYGALWIFVPTEGRDGEPAGLASAGRGGRRPLRIVRRDDLGQLVALGALAVGLLLLLNRTGWGFPLTVTVPVLIAGAGLALLWTQADVSESAWFGGSGLTGALGSGERPWVTVVRIVGGVVLVVVAVLTFLVGSGRPTQIGNTVLLFVVVALGLGLIAGPLVWRLLRQLDDERRERVLQQQQADMAAHLHDSVLQTLALIQRKADDPRAVMTLARAQERDLRGWLFENAAETEGTMRTALDEAAAEVEQAHGVPVEVVVVGDRPLDDGLHAMVRAAREAMVNAARHSGAASVDVFAECSDDTVEVFVRDRGKGFDPADVPEDRMGLRGSVTGRMERHGGTARIRSAPGEGTEVALMMGKAAANEPEPATAEEDQ
ncbi:PspC domain-containing protein [Angustibacter sp. McL0619]|uniref:ATP-binding protein n=1 Tax=Angustibacter sp. McL0619 TaxID=3415676 RepID=UPI003CF5DEFF